MATSLTIDSQSLDIAGAWQHNRSIRRLRSTIRSRGESRAIPSMEGRLAKPVVRDEVIVDLELMVFGTNDRLGSAHADEMSGLDENLDYLEGWVHDHIDGTTDTWTAELVTTSGFTYEAQVQILNWQILRDNGPQVVVSYDLRIPAGIWTQTGS